MIHVDVKKTALIPDGGGWRVHGRGSAQDKAASRATHATGRAGTRAGYTYIHSAIDGFSRLAYSECHDDETATTAVAFLSRARAFFRAHGITGYTRICPQLTHRISTLVLRLIQDTTHPGRAVNH